MKGFFINRLLFLLTMAQGQKQILKPTTKSELNQYLSSSKN
jgi:hypothetical protein